MYSQKTCWNNLITYKPKDKVQFQDNIKQNYLDYTSKHGKTYNSNKGSLCIVIQERKLTLEKADN